MTDPTANKDSGCLKALRVGLIVLLLLFLGCLIFVGGCTALVWMHR